jgi:hypothetical protein
MIKEVIKKIMAKLFVVKLLTKTEKDINVLAETPEEAQAKVTVAEGETVASIEEKELVA